MNQQTIIPEIEEGTPSLPDHDDTLLLFPVYVGGVFVGFETLNGDEYDPDADEMYDCDGRRNPQYSENGNL